MDWPWKAKLGRIRSLVDNVEKKNQIRATAFEAELVVIDVTLK